MLRKITVIKYSAFMSNKLLLINTMKRRQQAANTCFDILSQELATYTTKINQFLIQYFSFDFQ